MVYSKTALAAVAGFLSLANAHMKMGSPVPFSPEGLNNGPLDASGSDFPCKFNGAYSAGSADPGTNQYSVGQDIELKLIGSAVHGGGSCQISLTDDKIPTKDSVWKVIHSIEGGCPMNIAGNNGDDPSKTVPPFTFQIPSSFAPGQYTLAWSWVNRIGNREFYMNCAPIKVNGAAKKRWAPSPAQPKSYVSLAKRDDLPEIFVANIQTKYTNGCKTIEGKDTQYPNPGSSVDKKGDAGNLAPPAGCSGGSTGGSDSGSSDNSNSQAPVPSPSTTGGSTGGSVGGVFAPKPEAANTPSAPASSAPAPSAPAPSAPAPSAPPAAPPAAPKMDPTPAKAPAPAPEPKSDNNQDSEAAGAKTGPCSPEGAYVCLSGKAFQRCASGVWSVALNVSEGTVCSGNNGEFAITSATEKRWIKHKRHGH